MDKEEADTQTALGTFTYPERLTEDFYNSPDLQIVCDYLEIAAEQEDEGYWDKFGSYEEVLKDVNLYIEGVHDPD